jgi:excisionase family DNA binding protein
MSARERVSIIRGDVRLLTTGEVAALFQVSPPTVTGWAVSRGLVSTRNPGGGHYRFFEAEVSALLRGETRERARELGLAEKARLTGGAP